MTPASKAQEPGKCVSSRGRVAAAGACVLLAGSSKPLCVDLFCGLGGWAEGFLAEGYRVVGFDIERHDYGTGGYPGELVLQDVLTLHGAQFKDAAVIVASPPCQAYSYRAMPWKRAKALPPPSNELFDACFRIQREAIQAAGKMCRVCDGYGFSRGLGRCETCDGHGAVYRHIPLVVENVKGAQPWVGRARWHYGSFYLWGDVPALMPLSGKVKIGGSVGDDWFVHHNRQEFFDRANGHKNARNWWSDGAGSLSATTSSHSTARKAASAQIAKIPFPLAQHIARVYKPAVQNQKEIT